ncbi:hypothetical protein ACFZA2_16040 [Microbacterium sp. NPDC007973]|uniref:hypothetical protein n=1 Tax=Microbacterium sp. NPDC007973 TaxID=3364182 RepID=UPI0036F13369
MTTTTGIPSVRRSPLARAIGSALSAAFGLLQRVRHPRPIHSRGVVLSGEMRWIPDAAPSGIAFIDDAPGSPVRVVARVSRSLGLPAPLPDIIGLALRIDVDGTACDLELASTGWNVPGRFLLLPHRRPERARLGTLLPYRSPRGAVLLIARTGAGRPAATEPRLLDAARGASRSSSWILTLGHATPTGPWHPFAHLHLRLDPDQDGRGLRFDAVRRPIPGARSYAWVRAARQPSYARVQPGGVAVRMPRRR